jgi:hypothetical protein
MTHFSSDKSEIGDGGIDSSPDIGMETIRSSYVSDESSMNRLNVGERKGHTFEV